MRAQVSLVITSWQPVVVTPIEHTTAWGCILNTALKRLSRSSRRHRRWVIQCRPPVNLLQTAVETRRRRAGRAAWSAWSVRSVVAFRALVFATIVLARATMSLLWQRSHRSEGNFQKLKRKKNRSVELFPWMSGSGMECCGVLRFYTANFWIVCNAVSAAHCLFEKTLHGQEMDWVLL